MSVASGPGAGGGRSPSYPPSISGLPHPFRRTITSASSKAKRAAQYVRMSTEHQRYSTENQADAIRKYAEQKGLEIVRTYADEGKSGLRLDGRDGIKALIRDVQTGKA